MNLIRCRAIRVLGIGLALVLAARAQQNLPHAAYVYPAGGQQGATFEVTVGGQFLDGADAVYVSGAGIKAEIIGFFRPLPPLEIDNLRKQLKELQEKRATGAWTAADTEAATTIREKIATTIKRRENPAFAETVTLRVTIAPDATPGERELRLTANGGLTNPLIFCVGQLREVSKKAAWKAVIPLEERNAKALRNPQPRATPGEPPTDIMLPVTVNGEIMPGGTDQFHFQAHKGQHLVIAAQTRALIPYISDAVPGWFQAALTVYDSAGIEVAYADQYRFQQEPVILYEVPKDGEYLLQIRDALYRGREDFVYRVTVGELPFVTGIFPLGGSVGSSTPIALTGWNLPVRKITQSASEAGIRSVSIAEGHWNSNPIVFAADTLPEITANPRNHTAAHAQPLKLPIIVNGKIAVAGEWEVFRFAGRAGDQIVAEVLARRLNSPLDSVLKLTDARGKELAFNDDFEDPGAALITHQADSRIALKLPATGTYYLYLGDAQHQGGQDYAYRLRVGYARPDFELRVAPSSINIRPGMTVPISIYALRRNGFAGEIIVQLKDALPGLVLTGGRIPPGQDSVRATLSAPAQPIQVPRELYLEGEATIEGHAIRHPGIPADDMMQAFAWHHLVPAKNALVVVKGPGRWRNNPWKFVDARPLKLPAGGTAQLQLLLSPGAFAQQAAERLHLELDTPPDGIVIDSISHAGKDLALRLRADASKVKPGLKGNLIVDASIDVAAPSADGKPQANSRRVPLGVLPAIPFEIMER
jgi:hypothetical protein